MNMQINYYYLLLCVSTLYCIHTWVITNQLWGVKNLLKYLNSQTKIFFSSNHCKIGFLKFYIFCLLQKQLTIKSHFCEVTVQ